MFSVVGRFGDDIRAFVGENNIVFATMVSENGKRNLPLPMGNRKGCPYISEHSRFSDRTTKGSEGKGGRVIMIRRTATFLLLTLVGSYFAPIVQAQEEVIGSIKSFKPEEVWVGDLVASENMELKIGNEIRTGNSKAMIVLASGRGELEMGSESRAKVIGKTTFELFRGRLRVKVERERVDIKTPYVVAGVVGTDLLVEVMEDEAIMAVAKGQAEIRPLGSEGEELTLLTQQLMARTGVNEPMRIAPLPKRSKFWKWGVLGGSIVGLGGLAYLVGRLAGEDDTESNSISNLNDAAVEARKVWVTLDEVSTRVDRIEESAISIKQMDVPSNVRLEADGILADAGYISTDVDNAEQIARDIESSANDTRDSFVRIRTFLAIGAGIGVLASAVLLLLHPDVYAGVDDPGAWLLLQPEEAGRGMEISVGLRQGF